MPERGALSCAGVHRSFLELDRRANRLAHGLRELGVQRDEHVGIFAYNSVAFVETMVACYKIRAVPLNINFRYVGAELEYLLLNGDVTTLVFDRSLGPRLAALTHPLPKLRSRVVIDEAREPAGESDGIWLRYEELVEAGSEERDFEPRSADDKYVLYTGGTTGLPRGVVWRHEDIFFATLGGGNPGGPPVSLPDEVKELVHSNRAHRARPFMRPDDPGPDEFVTMALGPLIHASGQWAALGSLLAGGRTVLYPGRSMDMSLALDLVERERVTMLTLVGDTSGRPLLEELRRDGGTRDTSSLLLLGSGGSILSGDIKDGLLELLPSVLAISEAVGSSESPVQAVATALPGKVSPSMLFAPKQDATIVVDDALRPVAPGSGAVGRLATSGRVPIGYYNDPVKSDETFVFFDGRRWSLPGDMATVDTDGTIRLLGRGSLCINTGGEKVYPEEVEAVLKVHPMVVDAVVVGQSSSKWGQRVAAVVQPVDVRDSPTLDELAAHCRGYLAGYKVPRHLVIVSKVPRSASGKADYVWAGALVDGGMAPMTLP